MTLAEIRKYLQLQDTDTVHDELLSSFIDATVTEIETRCNRSLCFGQYVTTIINNVSHNTITIPVTPVHSVSEIRYFDGEQYSDLFDDAVSNHIRIMSDIGMVKLNDGLSVRNLDLQVVHESGYKFKHCVGTISIDAGSLNVDGVGTLFTTELAVGDKIVVNGVTRVVATITDNTNMTINQSLESNVSGATYVVNNFPDDLRNVAVKIASYMFLESPHAENFLHRSSGNFNLNSGAGDVYKDLNVSNVIRKYTYLNV